MPQCPPRVLSIAGSDSGGGAGIQADLKTICAHRLYGMSVVTAVTAQNTVAVTAVHAVPAEVVGAQIDAVFSDLGVDAVKIGMLGNAELVRVVAERLRFWQAPRVVLDPVMMAKSGDALLADDAVACLREDLLPLATVVTPNLPEAERLTGRSAATESERLEVAKELATAGPAVLVKGGHGSGQELVDLLWVEGGAHRFVHPRIDSRSTHGTGCTLSSALACRLARDEPLSEAVAGAIDYLQGALRAAYPLGQGHGPVDHLYRDGASES